MSGQVVTTVAELDALPPESVIESGGLPAIKTEGGAWRYGTGECWEPDLPATVLYEAQPDTLEPGEAATERVVGVLIDHQRLNIEKCACGWGSLGHSHAVHVALALAAAGLLATPRTAPADETAERMARDKAASLYPLDGEAPDVIFALRSAFRAGAEFALAASPADADTAERIARAIEALPDLPHRPSSITASERAFYRQALQDAARIAREHAASQPVAATSEETNR